MTPADASQYAQVAVKTILRAVRGGELDDAPRLAALDAIMQARSGPPPERPGLTVSSA